MNSTKQTYDAEMKKITFKCLPLVLENLLGGGIQIGLRWKIQCCIYDQPPQSLVLWLFCFKDQVNFCNLNSLYPWFQGTSCSLIFIKEFQNMFCWYKKNASVILQRVHFLCLFFFSLQNCNSILWIDRTKSKQIWTLNFIASDTLNIWNT